MKKVLTTLFLIIFTVTCVVPTLAATGQTALSPAINRISGQNRFDTACAIAQQGWPNGSATCILAYGYDYSDSLVATPLAKKYDAPILLTESAALTSSTRQTLLDLKTKNVIIIGGTGVISSDVDIELKSMGISTNRIFGADKYETSVAVAEQVTTTPSTVFVCPSNDFSEALSISPIASIKGDPIILVTDTSISDTVKDYISSNKIIKSYVIGTTDEISDTVANEFPDFERIAGNDRYSTNIAVNEKFESIFGFSYTTLASGEQFPDALSGSALSAKISAPIVLVNSYLIDETKSYYLQRIQKGTSNGTNYSPNIYVFGGSVVVPDSVIQALQQGQITTVSHLNGISVTTAAGTPPVLPSMTTATMSDGTSKNVDVTWESVNLNKYACPGTFMVLGTVAESSSIKAIASVTVTDPNQVPILTTQQLQQGILGSWQTPDGRRTLKFLNDGTLEETELLTGYTSTYEEKYLIVNPSIIRIVNFDKTEEDNFVLNGSQLIIYNLGISRIAGTNNYYNSYNSSNPINSFHSSDSSNDVFLKVSD
jgi:putative cell wall-binding protein